MASASAQPFLTFNDTILSVKSTMLFKLVTLLTAFPLLITTISIDRYLFRKRNPFLSIPRNTDEIRRDKKAFFVLLQSKAVQKGGVGSDDGPLIPSNAIMVYVDVKEGTAAEPEKNQGVARVDVAFRMPPGVPMPSQPPMATTDPTDPQAVAQAVQRFARFTTTHTLEDGTETTITVLRLFVKMTTARRWPVLFKAIVCSFSSTIKEMSTFNAFIPMMQQYHSGTGLFKNLTKPLGAEGEAEGGGRSAARLKAEREAAATAATAQHEPLPPLFPLRSGCPIPVPTCHYSTWSRLFDRSLSIFDCIDTSVWRPVADYTVVTEAHLLTLVRSIARMHAVTVGRVGHYAGRHYPDMLAMGPCDRLIYAQVGEWSCERAATSWLQSILDAFAHKMVNAEATKKHKATMARLAADPAFAKQLGLDGEVPPLDLTPEQHDALNDGCFFKRVWDALSKRLEKEVTAISHCDCRPGNKLFCGGGGGLAPSPNRLLNNLDNDSHPQHCDASDGNVIVSLPDEDDENGKKYAKNTATVIHLDWEACSMSPLLFDVSYIIAGRPERVRYETVLLTAYLEALRDAVEDRLDREGITEEAKRQTVLSRCVPSMEEARRLLKLCYLIQGY